MPATAQPPAAPLPTDLPSEVADHALVFPEGLVGCPDWCRFVLLVDADEQLPVATLASLDVRDVQLMATDPRLIVPDYSVQLTQEDRASLELDAETEPTLYCTLSLADDGLITANLLGPLVVNPVTRRGRQLVLAESTYSTRHPVAQITPDASEAE
jgi:flagellar assembly factor FliW